MSRKSKRASRREVKPSTVAPVTNVSPAAKPSGLNTDYSYVTKDLKRIGILAGSFLAILIILSFFLR